jgi:hypothetical protein
VIRKLAAELDKIRARLPNGASGATTTVTLDNAPAAGQGFCRLTVSGLFTDTIPI